MQSKAGLSTSKVSAAKPVVLQGEAGYSEKSPGNASFYYSYPRLNLSGTLTLEGERPAPSPARAGSITSGAARYWPSGNRLGLVFSLQFEDGRELMLFRLRTKAGRPEPENRYGILISSETAVAGC